MGPRRVFASVAEFSIYRLEQIREKADRAKANKRKRVQEMQRTREGKRMKGPPAVEAAHTSPKQTTQDDSLGGGELIRSSEDRRMHGKRADRENGSKSNNTNKIEAGDERLVDKEVQNKEMKPLVEAISDDAQTRDRASAIAMSHKASLERQFSSIMPKSLRGGATVDRTTARAGMFNCPEQRILLPRIRKPQQINIAEEDFGSSEKDNAFSARLRPPDAKPDRKGRLEEISCIQQRADSSPRTQVPKDRSVATSPRAPQLCSMGAVSALRQQDHQTQALNNPLRPDSVPIYREDKRQRIQQIGISSRAGQSGPQAPALLLLPHSQRNNSRSSLQSRSNLAAVAPYILAQSQIPSSVLQTLIEGPNLPISGHARGQQPSTDALSHTQTTKQIHPSVIAHCSPLVDTKSETPPQAQRLTVSSRFNTAPQAHDNIAHSRVALPEFRTRTRIDSQSRAHLKWMRNGWQDSGKDTAGSGHHTLQH